MPKVILKTLGRLLVVVVGLFALFGILTRNPQVIMDWITPETLKMLGFPIVLALGLGLLARLIAWKVKHRGPLHSIAVCVGGTICAIIFFQFLLGLPW